MNPGALALADVRRRISLKQIMLLLALGLAVAILALGLCVKRLGDASEEVARTYQSRYTSYLLADELRQSSDDLTRLARTYVVSGDPKWKQHYQELLDIRAGKRARPAGYHRIYWDFRAADIDPARGEEPAIALHDLMKKAGFTEAELAKLREAERNSNDLVRIETLAMGMVERNAGAAEPDAADLATARQMMHDETYHQLKAKIMEPVDEFFAALDQRTQAAIDTAERREVFWYGALVVVAIVTVILLVGSLWLTYRQLSRSLDEAVHVSDAIASGRLDIDVTPKGPREVASLLGAMSTMRAHLVSLVTNVRQNADAVAAACSHIAQGNSDLSARTQEQAGALQESAASMEELSATVHRNAQSAAQADQLSRGASAIAARSGEVVGRVVETMKGINESSGKIADIIGVIDSIAFQTNLLALNAAVEAARAGEQGRGFAVVAAEVRHLAQRSAEAAKQIRTLILDSVERVDQGTQLVDQAGATMNELVAAIRRVTDIMGEISAASAEQSRGVTQISQAIAQMDEATQQNAALVEESAAAAEMLNEQARQLVAAVAAFKLTSSASQAGESTRSAAGPSGYQTEGPSLHCDAAA
ncbi:MAG TPA: methyl-accepting chemotaxis protein [Steroidobacter sp.]